MTSQSPYIVTLVNPNVNSGDDEILYLISERDDSKNKLSLKIQNVSGAAVTFTHEKPLQLTMGKLPADVTSKIVVDGEAGWSSAPYTLPNGAHGLTLTPASSKTLDNGKILEFTLTNIVFTRDEAAQDGYPVDLKLDKLPPSKSASLKLLVKQLAPVPNQLFKFEAAFIAVPRSSDPAKDWNVKVGNTPEYIEDKANAAVYSNCAANRPIRTRLAFRLTNQDQMYPLELTRDSRFKVQFLAGDAEGDLANGQDLVNNIRITGSGDWMITQANDADSPEWTLQPKGSLSIGPRGGSCEFVVEAVLPNQYPTDNRGGPGVTEMYVFYSKVPQRNATGHLYEDGYLAATIEKVALEPRIPRIWLAQPDNGPHEINKSITVSWCALGVETVTISYIDQDGKSQTTRKDWQGSMQVTPPAYPPVRRTTTYQCTSEGGPAGCPVTVQSLFDKRYPKRQFALVYKPRAAAEDRAAPPQERSSTMPIFMFDLKDAVVTVNDGGHAELKLTCRQQNVHATGSWWAMASDSGDFSITFAFTLDANCLKLPYGSSDFIELPPAATFTLRGKCTGHDLTLGDVVASDDCFWVTTAINGKSDSEIGNYYEVFCRAGDQWKLS